MLIGIEVDSIHKARRRHTSGIEEMTSESGTDLTISVAQAGTSRLGSGELFGNGSAWRVNGRRADHQNRRDGHTGLDGRAADFVYQRGNTLRGGPGIVIRMTKLKIVGSQRQDYE